jgi:hypothetical protein
MTLNFQSSDSISMSLTEFDLDNLANILAEPSKYDWYGAHVLRLCQKADETNLRKIATIHPEHVAAFLIYWVQHIPERFHDVLPHWAYYERMMVPHIVKGNS